MSAIVPQPRRLAAGGLIDRATPLPFRFDGRDYTGYAGDTLASALLANGVTLFGRSFKYHRPRGVLSAGSEEPNALVELREGARREPNTPATMIELHAGLRAASQHRFPSLRFDLLAVNNLLAPLFGAGFYYKTFMWPASFWEKVYEPAIRRASGLGRAAGAADPDAYERAALFCDVLVIGGGPAGLAAAREAGRSGARVVLCDEGPRLGGRLLCENETIEDRPGPAWAASVEAELASLPELRILRRTTVVGVYDHGTYAALERVADHKPVPAPHEPRQRLWRIVARRAVLASGATERTLVFGGNDRPGVMLAGAVRSYLNRYAIAPGTRAVVLTSGDDGWRTVADCTRLGLQVAAVVDRRAALPPHLTELARRAGASVFAGGAVSGTAGRIALRGVEVIDAKGARHKIAADLLAMAGGWNPAIALTCHLDGKPVWDANAAAFVPGALPPGMSVAGAAEGRFTLAHALASGARHGAEAATACGFAASVHAVALPDAPAEAASPLWLLPPSRQKAFVDFQHDVAASDVALAHREGYRSVEHLKRYTTLGMATDQGRTANVNGLAIMAALTGQGIAETGTTRYRPPYTPVSLGALAGHHRGQDYRPVRLTPAHAWAKAEGAVFTEAGAWLRAQYFPASGETEWLQSVTREVNAVRRRVGVCDVSTLGKIELVGPDAAVLLDRIYANTVSTLKVGRARYGLMLREDGFVMDDGTVARLAQDRFIVSTTTAQAAGVLSHMEFCHQVLWPELDVHFVSVSDRWAQFAIAGPCARDVVQAVLDPGSDVSDAAFPFMAAAELRGFGGLELRLFRVSFSGERAYEIAVPARHGEAAIRAIIAAGAPHGIVPYGTETMAVMRIEKGHPAGGELNGQTTARDLGMERLVSKRKDFIGRALAQRPALLDPARPALVGIRPEDRSARLYAGAHFLAPGAPATAGHDQGWVSSVAFSPTLGHWIGLGFLANGPARHGERLRACDPLRGADVAVTITAPCQFDPEGVRLRG